MQANYLLGGTPPITLSLHEIHSTRLCYTNQRLALLVNLTCLFNLSHFLQDS